MTTVYLEHAAKQAGYLLPDEETEQAMRRNLGLARNEQERLNWARETIRVTTEGAELSDLEIRCFLDGFSIKDILAVRIANHGDIRLAHGTTNATEDDDGPENTAFCPSCRKVQPVTYGYVDRPTTAATVNLGGPIGLTRIASETEEQTFCAACGHRVFTESEMQDLEAEDRQTKANWVAVLVFAAFGLAAILAMIAQVS